MPFVPTECRDVLLPLMLRELSGALVTMADGPHDERKNSLELLNNILEVLSRNNVVRHNATIYIKRWSHLSLVERIKGTVHLIFMQLVFSHTCCSVWLRIQPSPTATSHYRAFSVQSLYVATRFPVFLFLSFWWFLCNCSEYAVAIITLHNSSPSFPQIQSNVSGKQKSDPHFTQVTWPNLWNHQ